jgi:hypothetical protein
VHKSILVPLSLFLAVAWAPDPAESRGARRSSNPVTPSLQIEPRFQRDARPRREKPAASEVRAIDGAGNHLVDTRSNAAFTPLARVAPADYADGAASLAGPDRPGARDLSNLLNAQRDLVPTPFGTSDYLWQWGQFLDHDMDLTEGVDPPEPAPIRVPAGDPFFDPLATGAASIAFNRSLYDPDTGTGRDDPREQLNEVTGWIDASNVYGSDEVRAHALRTQDGTGRLATGPDDLLPDGDGSLPNATGGSPQVMFVAGDVRANEQVGLAAMHTLFVREHNRLAARIRRADPRLGDDAIYERARRLVGAMMQAITYQEFLPALLGPDALAAYRGYDPEVDARIRNEFSTAAYRFGHSALSPRLLRLDSRLREIPEGHLALRDAFFSPDRLRAEGGIDPVLRGLAHQVHQRIDLRVVDDVRNFLFGLPGQGGFDLPALNIQRGRDHGLAGYNDAREAYGLPRAGGFSDVSADPDVQDRLAAGYDSVDDVDLWVGCLAEDPEPPSQVGPLARSILVEQFTALRDGDRFWYERMLGREELALVRSSRLSDVIRRNTNIRAEIPDDVFRVAARADAAATSTRRSGRRR